MFLNNRANAFIFLAVVLLSLSVFSCRGDDEEEKPQVTGLSFEEEKIKIGIGEQVRVRVTLEPKEARPYATVTFNGSVEGYITISDESNDGCVIKAEKGGSVVLVARANDYTAYLEVEIEQDIRYANPYIVIPTQVIELNEGSQRTVQVSLYNGVPTDNSEFEWKAEAGKDNIAIFATANTVVVKGEKRGSQKIMVSHPKSEYSGEILVFVTGVDEAPKYITTAQNIMVLETGGSNRQFTVNLVNGLATDKSGFIFSIVEGDGIVQMLTSNETCNVLPTGVGSALIRVTHPLAEYALDVRIIVVAGNEPVIEMDKTFVLLDYNGADFVTAGIGGSYREAWLNDFEFELSDEEVVSVIKTNNVFFLQALQSGSCILTVRNKNVTYYREVLIMVRSEASYSPDDYYITTSQNVVQLEMGQALPTQLTMLLVGGVEADRNGFSWIVEDGTVVTLESAHGEVAYSRSAKNRSAITNDVFNAIGLLTPKKVGQTKITVSHYKSASAGSVLVKVYPRGTFALLPITVGYEGLIKIDTTQNNGEVDVTLKMVSGDAENVGALEWGMANTAIAEISTQGTGLQNVIKGKASGNTKLTVDGANLKNPHESLVLVGTTEELLAFNYIYIDNIYQTVAEGMSVSVEVKDSNNRLSGSAGFQAAAGDPGIVYATMIKSRLLLQGLGEGKTQVVISNAQAENTVTVYVEVESANISIGKPYTIRGPDFVGMYYGQSEYYDVTMPGASEVELDKVIWAAESSAIVKVQGNGARAKVTAQEITGQTNVKVNHAKSSNEKNIVFYVVPTAEDLEKMIVLGIDKQNWLLRTGDEPIMLKLTTNATPEQKAGIIWGNSDIGVVQLDYSGDTAMVKPVGEGSTVIEVTHQISSLVVIPLKIYISVSDKPPESKLIDVPSIVEMIVGENKIIHAVTSGLSQPEVTAIKWSIDDEQIASISNDGDRSYVLGKKRGQTYITVEQKAIGYKKRVLLVCANTYEELANTYVMAAPETYYRINAREQKNAQLIFGQAGFPEAEKQNIRWTVTLNKVVNIYPNGEKIMFEGNAQGIATIKAEHDLTFSPVEIQVEVNATGVGEYQFIYESMRGLSLENPTGTLSVTITPDGLSYSQITFKSENEAIFTASPAGSGNSFLLEAKSTGQSYLMIEHPMVTEPARILIYITATEAELKTAWPIALAKTNYLVRVGETAAIKIDTLNDDPAKLNLISWGLDINGIASYSVVNKKEITIRGEKAGNCIFSIRYNNQVIERAYVSVREDNIDPSKKIATESIIGLALNQPSRRTTITSNLTSSEIATLVWESSNGNVATVGPLSGNRAQADITPVGAGETEITVSFGQIKRYIKVYVAADSAAVQSYKAVNLDTRYYQIRRNDEITLTSYHAAQNASSDDIWTDYYQNNVITLEKADKNKIRVKGINEGIATVILENVECLTNVMFMIEVSNTAPSVTENTELRYLTTSKTVYALDPQATLEFTRIQVTAIGFEEGEKQEIKWSIPEGSDKTVISLYPGGAYCDVAPNGKIGFTKLRAEHPKSANYLDIDVIVTNETIVDNGSPFIAASEETARMGNNTEKQITLSLINVSQPDIGQFSAMADNGVVEVSTMGNLLTIKAKEHGQSMVTVTHPQAPGYAKKIVVVVTTTADGLIYLTTTSNFVVIEERNYKAVEVELIGFNEYDNNAYTWEGDAAYDRELVSINGSGKSAVITGKKIGTAKVKITHQYALYPLYIYVRVTNVAQANPVYITTSNNIVSMRNGNSMQVKAELKNGNPSELSLFTWGTADRNVIELNYSGDTAMIRGLSPGTAGVTISHPASMNSITILAVVEPVEASSGIYIASDNLLVEMRPDEPARRLGVRLVGGTAEDVYGFQWMVVDYVSVLKNDNGTSRPVINLVANADVAYVSGLAEGEATIRVSHPKTAYKLEMKVVNMATTEISFAKKNLTLDMLQFASVDITSPTGQTIIYESSNARIAQVTGTGKVCIIEALAKGTAIIRAYNASGTKSDEMIVVVNEIDVSDVYYITTDTSLLTLATNQAGVEVSARIVRANNTSQTFENENNFLRWESADTSKVTVSSNGARVIIQAKNPGETEIRISYAPTGNMPVYPTLVNYIKRIYVIVAADTIMFDISDEVMVMAQNSTASVYAAVRGTAEVDYENDFEWLSSDTEVVQVNKIPATDKSLATLFARKEGIATVTVKYRNNLRYCTVRVDAQRVLSLTQTQVNIQPGVTIPNEFESGKIILTALPNDDEVTYSVDNYNSAEITVEPIRWEVQANGTRRPIYGDQSEVKITGKDLEGVTTVTFTAVNSGLKTTLTIYTVKNYYVKFKNKSCIRARPDVTRGNPSDYVVEFEINPQTDILELQSSWNSSGIIDSTRSAINQDNKTITVYPLKAGYIELIFKTRASNEIIKLPIYFFYESINVPWSYSFVKYSSSLLATDTIHSRVDKVQGAIFVADGEQVVIRIDDNALERDYHGAGAEISSANWVGSSTDDEVGLNYSLINNGEARLTSKITPDKKYVYDSVVEVKYIGVMKVRYSYFNGWNRPSVYENYYLVYSEKWRRKK